MGLCASALVRGSVGGRHNSMPHQRITSYNMKHLTINDWATPSVLEAGALKRRSFLQWSVASFSTVLFPGSASLALVACGANSAASAQPDITVLNEPSAVSVSMQSRKVQWVVGKSPAQANAWVYVADGITAQSGTLRNHLGPVFNVRRNVPCTVTWRNTIAAATDSPLLLASPPINVPLGLDMCGNVQTQSPVGLVTHLHGARVQAGGDGWPLQPLGFAGNSYGFAQTLQVQYANAQRSTMLWYHDHAMDRTGRHVHAGLAGVYFIRDAADDALLQLVGGATQEMLCVIQDRILQTGETAIDYAAGMPTQAPLARPEFLGNTLFVNGHPATTHTLSRGVWRLRILNGSNARTYALALCNPGAIATQAGQVWHSQCMRLVGADGGLMGVSVSLTSSDVLVLAPGQRRDVLLDLSQLPASVTELSLVNLALKPLLAVDSQTPEAIYSTFEDTVLTPSSASFQITDQAIYDAVVQPLGLVQRMALQAAPLSGSTSVSIPTVSDIDGVLTSAASDDDFTWNGSQMGARADAQLGPNRLVLLMSNTEGRALGDAVNGISGWSDVQIFEMQAGGSDWQIPFDVDLTSNSNPTAGGPSTATGYTVARRSFFAQESNPDITVAKAYPAIHAPNIRAQAGTYERWYVANIGNSQPLTTSTGDPPDMHPFHVHLVNFIVTRRWQLDDAAVGGFGLLPNSALDLDGIARQDTVLIPSNQIVELLVHFPVGYRGDYVYHCHILEHEDMCMMSHFQVA